VGNKARPSATFSIACGFWNDEIYGNLDVLTIYDRACNPNARLNATAWNPEKVKASSLHC
jgi:hypothetical protein